MELEPLQIEEAINGVIKMSAVEKGGTAIIPPRTDPQPDDEIHIYINGKVVVTIYLPEPDDKEIKVEVPTVYFLSNSGQGPVAFHYVIYTRGGVEDSSKPVNYEIHLA
jgi:hypothetical protein